jgi:hypothetical protein
MPVEIYWQHFLENDMQEYNVMVYTNETYWAQNGQLHRIGGPAIETTAGTKMWFHKGVLHREDGPAVEKAIGDKEWWVNGQRHREDGPAIERVNGHNEWFQNGQRHRIDGPAIVYANGDKSWHLYGQYYPEAEYHKAIAPVKELTMPELEKLLGHKVKIKA